MPPSRGGASAASEHGVAACHLRGELENETHGLPFTDWLATDLPGMASKQETYRETDGYGTMLSSYLIADIFARQWAKLEFL